MIPRVAHFVFGLREQTEPFHFLHYVSLESCRRVLQPERIYFHHRHLPWGPWWERIRPHLTLVDADLVPEVLVADYSEGPVPSDFRYAHHSDFVRLDALLAYGGGLLERHDSALRGDAVAGGLVHTEVALLAAHTDPPRVRLVTRALSNDAISALHRRGDRFVSLARAEGWGLGAFDAAAHGTPVVTTSFGGQLDHLAGSPHLVRFELIAVDDPAGGPSYAPNQRWAEPDVEHAAMPLREIAADPAAAVAGAAPRAADNGERYRPSEVAAMFRAAVDEHAASADDVHAATACAAP